MNISKKILIASFFLLTATSALAQEVEMADAMRSNGKIYAVVAVVLLILFGLFAYLWTVDRKISRIEKEHQD